MAVVGLLTVSDGRRSVHEGIVEFTKRIEDRIAGFLEADGHTVHRASEPIWTNELAVREARRIADARPDLTIVNIPVWAFPHFTMLAARETPGPLLLFSNVDPQYPGMVGDARGRRARSIRSAACYGRVWGDIADPAVLRRVDAAHPRRRRRDGPARLRRSAASAGARWGCTPPSRTPTSGCAVRRRRRGDRPVGARAALRGASSRARVEAGREWLEAHARRRPLRRRPADARAARAPDPLLPRDARADRRVESRLLRDQGPARAHEHFCTMDVTEAFLNDPYDWDGPKEPHVCATEADMDAALTMQILKRISGTPVLFADVRHYHADLGIWDLCNSGQHATWFAARSDDPAENLRARPPLSRGLLLPGRRRLVHHLAAPGRLHVRAADAARRPLPDAGAARRPSSSSTTTTNERLMRASTYVVAARLRALRGRRRRDPRPLRLEPHPRGARRPRRELRIVCRLLDVDYDGFGTTGEGAR